MSACVSACMCVSVLSCVHMHRVGVSDKGQILVVHRKTHSQLSASSPQNLHTTIATPKKLLKTSSITVNVSSKD